MTHLSDDETAAKMGHPVEARLDVGHLLSPRYTDRGHHKQGIPDIRCQRASLFCRKRVFVFNQFGVILEMHLPAKEMNFEQVVA
jgi:hypothetical protein